jgi:uncharacterized RDD family membrane protein YckC
MDWFYAKNNQQNGPVSHEVLVSMLQQGQVGPGDLVWRDGMGSWQPAGTVAELAAVGPAANPALGYFNPVPMGGPPPMYAGFWLRFVAWLLDAILLGLVNFVLGVFIGIGGSPLFGGHHNNGAPFTQIGMALSGNVVSILTGWLYFSLMETSLFQATLGKMALSLVVTDLSGQPITFGRATGRYFGKIISGFTILIGYMMAGWTQQKQALHDIMAGCLVLRKP